MSQLSFRYEYSSFPPNSRLVTDDFGLLEISVQTERFSGKGRYWVQWQDVRDFGESLTRFPIAEDKPLRATWGYNMEEGDDLILSIEIAPSDRRGNLVVRVEIADLDNRRDRVRASLQANYQDLLDFHAEIAKLMNREIEEAVLKVR